MKLELEAVIEHWLWVGKSCNCNGYNHDFTCPIGSLDIDELVNMLIEFVEREVERAQADTRK